MVGAIVNSIRPAQLGGGLRSKVVEPAAQGLIGHDDPALSQQILYVAKALGESKMRPNRRLNDLGRKPVAAVLQLRHGHGRRNERETASPDNVKKPANP